MTGLHRANGGFLNPFSMRASLDMYTEGGPATGPRRFLQPDGIAGPCPCPHCARYGGPGYRAASSRQPDDSHLDGHRDTRPPRVQDVGGRASGGGHWSPRRQPVFQGPGPCSHSDDLAQLSPPRELNPAQWSRSSKLGARHCPSFREQCDCVTAYNRTRAHPFHLRIPHPLPHLRVNGQVHGYSRTVHYDVFVDRGEDALQNGHLVHGAPKHRVAERRDTHQEAAVSGENWNGHPHKSFFPTEVPQKHFAQDKPNAVCICTPVAVSPEAAVANRHQGHVSFLAKQATEQESVRNQIRQVVTDLEDVLGGLKQIHVEMKEVGDRHEISDFYPYIVDFEMLCLLILEIAVLRQSRKFFCFILRYSLNTCFYEKIHLFPSGR